MISRSGSGFESGIRITHLVLGQFEGFNADLTLVANPQAMKFHPVRFEVLFADHQIAISTFDHIAGAVEGVHPIIGDGYVFFTAACEKREKKM